MRPPWYNVKDAMAEPDYGGYKVPDDVAKRILKLRRDGVVVIKSGDEFARKWQQMLELMAEGEFREVTNDRT